MDAQWKRPKVIPSKTENVLTSCGKLFVIFGYEDEERTRLVEIHATIGKGGNPCNVLLHNLSIATSIILQSTDARYKLIKKFKKQFMDAPACINPFMDGDKKFTYCFDWIIKRVIKNLEEQIG